MPLNLPRPNFGFLPRSPLELVVCQVRHDSRPVTAELALAIQEEIAAAIDEFDRIEEVEIHTAAIAVAGGAVSPGTLDVAKGWHIKSADGQWTAAVLPDHVSLETTDYIDWATFVPRLESLIRAVHAIAPPAMEQRLGLRYVDRVSEVPGVAAPQDWSGWIHPSVLGPVLHPVLGPAVRSARQQIDFDLEDGRSCVLRHGTVSGPEDAPVYLLDFDVYRQQAKRFDPIEIVSSIQSFHELADGLFGAVITPDLLQHLKAGENE